MEVVNLPIQTKELECSGQLHSVEDSIKLMLLESGVEEIAVAKDLPKPEFLLVVNYVDHCQIRLDKVNGTRSLATTANLLLVVKSNW
jgi:hypothetical protein